MDSNEILVNVINPNFDTDSPPPTGTKARAIWDKENKRRLDDKEKKILKLIY